MNKSMDHLLRESYLQTALKKMNIMFSFSGDFSLKDKKPLVYTQTHFSYFETVSIFTTFMTLEII